MKDLYLRMNNKGYLLGAHFEKKVQDKLTDIKKASKKYLWFKRYYDSKSAGGYLPEQPADYQVATLKNVWLLELKSSFLKESLSSCLSDAVDGQQAVAHKLWNRVNKPSVFLFFCAETEQIEVWDGRHVAEVRLNHGERLSRSDRLARVHVNQLGMILEKIFMEGFWHEELR